MTEHHLRGFQLIHGVNVQSRAVPVRKQIQTYFQAPQRPHSSQKHSLAQPQVQDQGKRKKIYQLQHFCSVVEEMEGGGGVHGEQESNSMSRMFQQ